MTFWKLPSTCLARRVGASVLSRRLQQGYPRVQEEKPQNETGDRERSLGPSRKAERVNIFTFPNNHDTRQLDLH